MPLLQRATARLQRAVDNVREAGIQVAVLSVDDEAATQALIDKHHLSFRAGHSANAREVARLTGAFLNEDPLYIQSTGFILDPAGRVVVSVYSSGAVLQHVNGPVRVHVDQDGPPACGQVVKLPTV